MLTAKESQAIAAANPSQGELRATAAFTGPGTTVSTTTKPKHYVFDPEDKLPERPRPYIPKKYVGRMFDTRTDQTLQQQAELYGLETVEIILPEGLDKTRTDWGCVGLRGKFLKPGDREQMPVNHAIGLVQSGRAVFVLDSTTKDDERKIAELEAKGYQFATTQRPAREREEFQSVFARKKSRNTWMSGVLQPGPGEPSTG
jgi:hypothetical protein